MTSFELGFRTHAFRLVAAGRSRTGPWIGTTEALSGLRCLCSFLPRRGPVLVKRSLYHRRSRSVFDTGDGAITKSWKR